MKSANCKTVRLAGLALLWLSGVALADDVLTSREITGWTPYFGGEVGRTYVTPSYEYSSIHLGQNQTDWHSADVQIVHPFNSATPYVDVAYYDRNYAGDFALTAGSYFKPGADILQVEVGAGLNPDFIYQFQSTVEYQYLLCKNLYGKVRARYMQYASAGDVWMGSPAGLIYYFGDHYVTADYDISSIAGRGTAQWGSVKADFTVNPRWGFYTGAAAGERLFDMSELPASLENGYILFAGCRFRMLQNTQLTVGCSYSEEQPNFIKRSIDASVSVKL
jgi:YaiO family outer membrane protein